MSMPCEWNWVLESNILSQASLPLWTMKSNSLTPMRVGQRTPYEWVRAYHMWRVLEHDPYNDMLCFHTLSWYLSYPYSTHAPRHTHCAQNTSKFMELCLPHRPSTNMVQNVVITQGDVFLLHILLSYKYTDALIL